MSGFNKISDTEFVNRVIPQLALYYRREALYELEGKCPWLKVFTSEEPDFNEARGRFFSDGSACILNLEKYIELTGLAVANEALTISYGVPYIIFMAKLHAVFSGTAVDKRLVSEDRDNESALLIDRIQSERETIGKRRSAAGLVDPSDSFLEVGEQIINDYRTRNAEFSIWYTPKETISLWQETLKEDVSHHQVYDEILHHLKVMIETSPSRTYISNVKNFTYNVGCPEAQEDPRGNIAALRKFHATQMPFFQKLQDDLQAQIKVNNEQQEIITALVFRHLIEHLPPNPYKNKTNATERWLAFWEDAVRTAYVHPTDHPLKGLVNEKVFPQLSKPLVEASTKKSVTRDSTGLPVDKDFIKGKIDERGEKAQMYRFGKDLFGVMSKNIHAYETKGKGGYKIGSDHWGKGFRDILERLVPTEYDRDDAGNDTVNWKRERERYVPADGILLTTTAEEPGESGTSAQLYDRKLNGYP